MPLVLGLIAVASLLGMSALHDALFGQQLAGSRFLQQRAGMLAAVGIGDAMARLQDSPGMSQQAYALALPSSPSDSATVRIREVGRSELPAGFSSGQFIAVHLEIESTAHGPRGTHMTQVQGVVQVTPRQPPDDAG